MNLPSNRCSNLVTTSKMLFASNELRMLSATFIVKSTSTRSSLGNALNHTPARIAFNLSLLSWFVVIMLEGIVGALATRMILRLRHLFVYDAL